MSAKKDKEKKKKLQAQYSGCTTPNKLSISLLHNSDKWFHYLAKSTQWSTQTGFAGF